MRSRLAANLVLALVVTAAPATSFAGEVVLTGSPRIAHYAGIVHMAGLPRPGAVPVVADAGPLPRLDVPPDAPVVPGGVVRSGAAPASAASGEPGAPTVASSFAAAGDNGAIPPDVMGAAGPSHLVTTLNGTFRIQNRSGALVSDASLAAFWSGVATGPFDPRIVYDARSARWFHVAVGEARASTSKMLIAASATSDPTGAWHRYVLVADSTGALWADYPTIGLDDERVVLQANMFRVDNGTFGKSRVEVFSKAALLAGSPAVATQIDLDGYGGTHQPSVAFEASDTTWLLQDWNGNSGGAGYVRLYKVSGIPATITAGPMIAVPETWATSGNARLDFAPQKGSAQLIQTNDSRMGNVVLRHGSLWASQTIFLPADGPSRSSVQWWQIDPVAASVSQRGRIDDPSGALFAAFPSIAVNANADVLVGHARFSPFEYASAGYAFRYGTDAAGTIRAGGILKAGEAPYYKAAGSPARNRWGDYTATVVDPVDDVSMWTLQEYAVAPSGGVDKWATWWGRLVPNPGPASLVSPASVTFASQTLGTTSAARTVTLTNAGSSTLSVGPAGLGGANAGDFILASDTCSGVSLAPGASCGVGVSFRPAAQGTRSASLSLPSSSPTAPDVVAFTGTGIVDPPRIAIEPGSVSFGTVAVGMTAPARTVTVRNAGGQSLSVGAAAIEGAADFTITSDGCNRALAPGASCTISLGFRAAALGDRAATLRVPSGVGSSNVLVDGRGVDVVPPRSTIATGDGAFAFGSMMPVAGGASDDLSGVRSVRVTFTPMFGSATTSTAALSCNAARTSCTWTVTAPTTPGFYDVTTVATDVAWNVETSSPGITIFVL